MESVRWEFLKLTNAFLLHVAMLLLHVAIHKNTDWGLMEDQSYRTT